VPITSLSSAFSGFRLLQSREVGGLLLRRCRIPCLRKEPLMPSKISWYYHRKG